MSLNIALISPAHPLRGGIAALSERLALALQEQGHRVIIYSFKVQYPAALFPGKTQYTSDPAPEGLTIRSCVNSINPFNWPTVGRSIARQQPDLVIVRFWMPFFGPSLGTVLRALRFFSSKKMRVTGLVDNIIPHEHRPGDRLLARYFLSACDDFVVLSQSVGAEIRQFEPQKTIRYAPHPIYDIYGPPMERHAARAALGLPQEVPLALFFGFIRHYKGLDLLLQALSEAPAVHAVIAGECYEDWATYQAIITQNGLEQRVHVFPDFIAAEQVRVFFGAADLVVQPYRSATQSGISQIAYHFEKPMIVTDVGGLAEIVPHGVAGYVVPPQPAAIAAALRDFFQHDRSAALTAGVRAEKQRFSWTHLTEQILAQ